MRQSSLEARPSLFIVCLFSLCFAYFVFQYFFSNFDMFSVDEFWFAHRTLEFNYGLPYRDFAPYKTVLGYYILLWPVAASHGILAPLLNTKHFIVLINTLALLTAGVWLRRFFPKLPILIALTLLIVAEFTLDYSANIRVDLLGYWLCLFSILWLLDKRYCVAGIALGLGFLITQKVLWYFVATNIALGMHFLLYQRDQAMVKNVLKFNACIAVTISAYILFWSSLSNFHTVIRSVFYEAYLMYQLDIYDSTRKFFWQNILSNNAFLFFLAPSAFLMLCVQPARDHGADYGTFVFIIAAVILSCLVPYKQIFLYYLLVALPALLLLYTAFFSWLLALDAGPLNFYVGKMGLWSYIITYILAATALICALDLALNILLILAIPLLLGIYITGMPKKYSVELREACLPIIFMLTLFAGVIMPAIQFSQKMLSNNNHYQRSTLALMDALLSDGGDYVAGIELLLHRDQPINGLRHSDAREIAYLFKPTEKNSRTIMASLYDTPVTVPEIVDELKHSAVKFYVNNYRMAALPLPIKDYLRSQYLHFWGSIYLYAPQFSAGNQAVNIKFSGDYALESQQNILLDGQALQPHAIVHINKGQHASTAATAYRLKLLARVPEQLKNPAYEKDFLEKVI